MSGHIKRQPAMVSAARLPIRPRPATCSHPGNAPEKKKVGGPLALSATSFDPQDESVRRLRGGCRADCDSGLGSRLPGSGLVLNNAGGDAAPGQVGGQLAQAPVRNGKSSVSGRGSGRCAMNRMSSSPMRWDGGRVRRARYLFCNVGRLAAGSSVTGVLFRLILRLLRPAGLGVGAGSTAGADDRLCRETTCGGRE